jgi:transcriptional regulator with XRE-family HTH domain
MKPSEQLKQVIRQSPLTTYRIAKLAGIRGSVLSLFLSGKRTITVETMDALAEVLGLSIHADGRDRRAALDAPKPGRLAIKTRKSR